MKLLRAFVDFDAALDWPFDDDELLDDPAPRELVPQPEPAPAL